MQFRRDLGKAQAHFFSVWKKMHEGGALPQKHAIGIRELRHYVACYAIIHLDSEGAVVIWHSGTGLDEIWGRNIAGSLLTELVPAKAIELLNWFFRSMLKQPCGGHSEEVFTKDAGDRYQIDLLYLPVLKKNGDRALAAMADVKVLEPADYVHLPAGANEPGQVIQYADFIDLGYGMPAGYYES